MKNITKTEFVRSEWGEIGSRIYKIERKVLDNVRSICKTIFEVHKITKPYIRYVLLFNLK